MQYSLAGVLSILPPLLAYVGGLVICALCWRRYPRAAQLAFLGTSFLIIAALGQPLVSVWIIRQVPAAGAGEMLSILALIAGVVRATGYGFLFGAVFIGRDTVPMGFPIVNPPLRSSPSDRTLL